MRRRTILKLFGGTLFLPFIQARTAQAQSAYDGLVYSDSDSNDPIVLGALGDQITNTGGVSYAA